MNKYNKDFHKLRKFFATFPNTSKLPEIFQQIQEIKLINAIKIYRAITGEGLHESKKQIEFLKEYDPRDLYVKLEDFKNNYPEYFL